MEISFVQILERIGFAPFVVLWYLLRGDKRHEKQTDALVAIAQNQALLHQKMEDLTRRQEEFERRIWALLTERLGVPGELAAESSISRRLPLPPPLPPPLAPPPSGSLSVIPEKK